MAVKSPVPEVSSVKTHLEPLTEEAGAAVVAGDAAAVGRIVRDTVGVMPDDVRFLETDEGVVAQLTLRLGSETALADAHAQASRIEEEIRRRLPEIADVVIHTEPAA